MSADDNDLVADDTISQGVFTSLAHSEENFDGGGFESAGEDVLVTTRTGGDGAEFQEHIGPWSCFCGFVSHTRQHWTRGCVTSGSIPPPTTTTKTSVERNIRLMTSSSLI